MRNTLILLLSGKIHQDLEPFLGTISNLRIPTANSLYSQRLIENNLYNFENIILTVTKEDLNIARIYEKKYEKITIVLSKKDYSLDKTLLKVFRQMENISSQHSITILFGDCANVSLPKNDCIITGYSPFPNRWATCSRDSNENLDITEIECANRQVVAGAFVITNANLFIEIFLRLFKFTTNKTKKIIYQALEAYDNKIKIELKVSKSWYDLGHKENYFHTKKSMLNGSSRLQNTMHYNVKLDSVVKVSNTKKICDEIEWYKNLPNEIMKYVPEILSSNSNAYEAKYIAGVSLAELWISNSDLLEQPKIYLRQLEEILNVFTTLSRDSGTMGDLNATRKYLFYDKLVKRLDNIKSDLNFIDLNNLIINNKKVIPLDDYLTLLSENLEQLKGLSEKLVFSHGDLFFGNILISNGNRINLIDPKGFTFQYSDPLYDVCKLSQSIIANYDYIAADVFSVNYERHRIDFEVPNNLGNQYNKDYQSFLQKRFDILNMDYKFLNLLTSSLLLSAIPFHSENKERQLVMFSKSLEMVSDY